MTDEEYKQKIKEDEKTISYLCKETRGAFIRNMNELLIEWRRAYRLPRDVSPMVHWNPHQQRMELSSMADAAAHYKQERSISGKPRRSYNWALQTTDVMMSEHINKIYAFADRCGLKVVTTTSNGSLSFEAPNREALDRFFALCNNLAKN